MAKKQTAYDDIPYPSNPFPYSRPERLSAIAKLFGLDAPAPETCRVLELGCSMGTNLLVIAQDHPGSRCVGVDASSRQIAEGWKTIDALGLKNIQIKHLDILEVGDDFGEFDYIISHGVFSWVPLAVQNKMLEICKRLLAPKGIAYISYNTNPGWHIRGILRDMMLYRGMQFADPDARLAQAKSLVEFVAQASLGSDTPYQRLLQSELKHIGRMQDYYLHHEYLEENNQPLYFNEFAKRLAVNGLQYLGDAEFSTMVAANFSPEVTRTLNELGAHDIVQMEQYMDYGEQVSLNAIKQLPKGVYSLAEKQDSGQIYKVTVEITDNEFIIDLRDNPDQDSGPFNMSADDAIVAFSTSGKTNEVLEMLQP